MINNPWLSLEELPHLIALAHIWRKYTGLHFDAFSRLCLDTSDQEPHVYPCPIAPICHFRIQNQPTPEGHYLARCTQQFNRPPCPDLKLSRADLVVLELNWQKLGRAICKAFGLNPKFKMLDILNTAQIGTWSADEVPVMLSIQYQIPDQHLAIAELVATLGAKFILFAPTSRTVDVSCTAILNRVGAQFFPLDLNTTLTPSGTLLPIKTPGVLFAAFAPQNPEALDQTKAAQLFALSKTLDSPSPRKAQFSTILRLYCVDSLEPGQIARHLQCSRALVYSRLQILSQKLGCPVAALRQYSSHLEKITESLSDPRARRIQQKHALDDSQQE